MEAWMCMEDLTGDYISKNLGKDHRFGESF